MSDGRVERTERLLNLVFCLMAARRAVSRAAIQASVPGYSADQGDAAFERMFERDKDELRQMGIPVETVLDVNGDAEGYRIRGDAYRLDPIPFSPDELRVIALAAQVWDEAILGPVATMALRKIEAAQGTAPVHAGDLRMSVQLAASDQALLPMLQAVRERRAVAFDYRGASDEAPRRRRVDPWAVVSQQARWYVVGFDHEREAPRAFRLSRITGPVSVTATAQRVAPDPAIDLTTLIVPGDPEDPARATVRVRAGAAAQLRRMAAPGLGAFEEGVIEVSAPSRAQLVAAILGAGASATVLAPDDIREAVVAGLRAVSDQQGVAS